MRFVWCSGVRTPQSPLRVADPVKSPVTPLFIPPDHVMAVDPKKRAIVRRQNPIASLNLRITLLSTELAVHFQSAMPALVDFPDAWALLQVPLAVDQLVPLPTWPRAGDCCFAPAVVVLKRKNPRPRLSQWDRLFWVASRRFWSRWAEALIVVRPETVVSWHRAGFRLYWRFLSRRGPGRPRITSDLRRLIQRLARDNPLGGAPRIHGELLKLGFDVSERTISRTFVAWTVERTPQSAG